MDLDENWYVTPLDHLELKVFISSVNLGLSYVKRSLFALRAKRVVQVNLHEMCTYTFGAVSLPGPLFTSKAK